MINNVSTISFGTSKPASRIKKKVEDPQITKKEVIGATVGTGVAATVANSNKFLTAIATITGKTQKLMGKGVGRFNNFKSGFIEFLKTVKPLSKFANNKAVGYVGGTISGLSALAICATDASNLIKVTGDAFGKSRS